MFTWIFWLEIVRYTSLIIGLIYRLNEEKDARGYLHTLANKMTDELENLKLSGPVSVLEILLPLRIMYCASDLQ